MALPLNIVILAAGKGTRMLSERPKVLHRLAGKPLLEHVVATARQLAPARLVVVYGHGGEAVPAAIPGDDIQWVLQAQQLGTGHAVAQALPALPSEGLTLVLYGDVPLTPPATLTRLLQHAGADRLALVTVHLPNPTGYGRILRDEAGRVVRIVEEKDASSREKAITEVNTGILVAPTPRLQAWLGRLSNANAQGEYYLTDVIAMAVAEGLPVVTVHPHHEWEVQGVNSKLELATLERIYQRNHARALAGTGTQIMDLDRIDVRGELTCGRDVVIDVNCVFEGRVHLEDGVEVGPHCVLKDVTVGKGTRIHAFSYIEGARIGPACRVGPFARIRPGTVLAQEVHVGNFVEVKASEIGEGSKVNHLSYVGDATVGRRVNIGAGTITCNYDGANKHRTVIEDDAFIGSDSQLVAPVTVGAGATLGAGTTLTRDAPPGQLTLSRVRQTTIPGWQRPRKKANPDA
jgi:bifunctional UDP-N-acetylglucosamine pyrophosphorylase/glucosamine-1-phosphate N-acetyltransferase